MAAETKRPSGLTCIQCKKKHVHFNLASRVASKYCSLDCSDEAARSARPPAAGTSCPAAAAVAAPPMCHNCGKKTIFTDTDTGKPSKYCSSHCLFAHAAKVGALRALKTTPTATASAVAGRALCKLCGKKPVWIDRKTGFPTKYCSKPCRETGRAAAAAATAVAVAAAVPEGATHPKCQVCNHKPVHIDSKGILSPCCTMYCLRILQARAALAPAPPT